MSHADSTPADDGALLAAVFDATDSVIVGLRPDHRIFLWNPAAEALYQTPRADALGTDYVARFIAPEYRDAVAADIREVLAGKRTRQFADDSILPDGTRRTLLWNVSRVADPDGRPVGIVAVGQDATARTEAEERFRAIFEHSHDGLLIADDTGVLDANPAALAMLGLDDKAQLVGRRAADFSPPVQPDGLASNDKSRRLGAETLVKGALTFEWMHRRRNGTDVPVEVSVRHAMLAGRRVSVVAWHDLTRQRALEAERGAMRERAEAAQRMEAVGRLASGIAHDFNNLLTVMRNAVELAMDDLPADHPIREELAPAQRANAQAHALARQLLALARDRPPSRARVELGAVVREMLALVRAVAGNAPVEATLPDDALHVDADRTELEQVLLNLVMNARDALRGIPADRARIDIAVERAAHGDEECIVLAVRDTGCGMDEATRARALEPFFTTKGVGEGTGLGLAVVYGVVTRMGGSVAIDSSPGNGTHVRVQLPPSRHVASARGAASATPGGSSAEEIARRPRRVLLVDDDAAVRRSTRRLLERDGWQVVEATDGVDGLWSATAAPESFGIVVSDVRMPGLDGLGLAARLAQEAPALPVLLYSGFDPDPTRLAGLPSPLRVIPKPFTRAVLRDAMHAAIRDTGAEVAPAASTAPR